MRACLSLVGAFVLLAGAQGCGKPSQGDPGGGAVKTADDGPAGREDPQQAFLHIAQRAFDGDTDYVRSHLAQSVIEAAIRKNDKLTPDDVVRRFRDQLQRFRPNQWLPGKTPNEGTVDAFGLDIRPGLIGSVWQFRMDMRYDVDKGWQITSEAYGHRRIGESTNSGAAQPAPGGPS